MTDKVEKSKNIHQRIAAVMGAVSYIQKDPKKEGLQYRAVSHDAVTAKLRPAIVDAGLTYYPVACSHTQNGNRTECSMTIRFTNIDDPADFLDVQSFGYGVDGQDKGPGKAMSYAVKYALLKMFGLETGDDPENESIAKSDDDPHAKPPAPKVERNPAKLRDSLTAILTNTMTADDYSANTASDKFRAALAWLQAEDPPKHLEVVAAMNAAEKRLLAKKLDDEIPDFDKETGEIGGAQ